MQQYDTYKTSLEAELSQITEQLETIATQDHKTGDWIASIKDETTGSADENVVTDATEEWGTHAALLEQLETRYRNITRALEKMKLGTYGICEISGLEIEPERLQINPAARTTIANRDREKELPL